MQTIVDQTRCPLCEGKNLCGVNDSAPCWCVNSDIKRELLDHVPIALAKKSCICKKCIDKFNLENVVDKS